MVTRLPPFLAGAMALRWRLRGEGAEPQGVSGADGQGQGAARVRERAEGTPGALEGDSCPSGPGHKRFARHPPVGPETGAEKNLAASAERERLRG